MGSAFHQLYPRYSGTLTHTAPTRVSTVREKVREKNIFSRSGNCQGILKFVREFWNSSKSQGILK